MSVRSRRTFLSHLLATGAVFGSRTGLSALELAAIVPDIVLSPGSAAVEVAPGGVWNTWAYNGRVPGPLVRLQQGREARLRLANGLAEPTTIHWHGIPVPNAMDGVSGLTQPPVQPGSTFDYVFTPTVPGTYLYHSHHGLQMDRGLIGPLIVDPTDPSSEPASDREYVLVLDDWLTITPEEAMAQLERSGMGMGGGSDTPSYAGYLVNGSLTAGAATLTASRGERVRLRLVNAASSTTFRVGLVGHRMTVTHTDGQPVRPVVVDTLTIGMGERYDVIVSADSPGAYPLLVGPADSAVPGVVVPFVYTGSTERVAPPPVWPTSLTGGRALSLTDLVALTPRSRVWSPDRVIPLRLGRGMGGYVWTINGQAYPNADPIVVSPGERIRFAISNGTMMRHPMHLHGHFFYVRGTAGGDSSAPLKDTVLVEPMASVEIDAVMDNPGQWLIHCHNAYHMDAGMLRVIEYR